MPTIVKVEVAMVGFAVVGFFVLAIVGHFLQTRGIVRDAAAVGRITLPFLMILFVMFGCALIGLMFHVFIIGQGKIGNADVGPVAFARRSETGITIGIWAFLLLGTAIAYPAMKKDMLGPQTPAVPTSKGILHADIGMTMDEVRGTSTLELAKSIPSALTHSTQTVGDVVFDFDIGGARFEQCRYYFITTGSNNDPHINSINVGISPFKKPHPECDAEQAIVIGKLAAAGWVRDRDERHWIKSGTRITLLSRRMDDAKPEEAADAGEFILVMEIGRQE